MHTVRMQVMVTKRTRILVEIWYHILKSFFLEVAESCRLQNPGYSLSDRAQEMRLMVYPYYQVQRVESLYEYTHTRAHLKFASGSHPPLVAPLQVISSNCHPHPSHPSYQRPDLSYSLAVQHIIHPVTSQAYSHWSLEKQHRLKYIQDCCRLLSPLFTSVFPCMLLLDPPCFFPALVSLPLISL